MFTLINMQQSAMLCFVAISIGVLAFYAIASSIVGVVFVERVLHLPREDKLATSSLRMSAAHSEVAGVEDVRITAPDGVRLVGWYVRPLHDNGSAVILLHGAGHDRVRVEKQALILLRHGYRVLMPDSRGQGHSEGRLTTFGIEESGDVERWISWLQAYDTPLCTYGYGQSMGALILLRSLAVENRFCAVIADSSPISIVEEGYDLFSHIFRLGPLLGRWLGRGPMAIAALYSRCRYGIDLEDASAERGLRWATMPVLLIQGAMDLKVSPRHAGHLSLCNRMVEVWYVPEAGHSTAINVANSEYEARLLRWFNAAKRRNETKSLQT